MGKANACLRFLLGLHWVALSLPSSPPASAQVEVDTANARLVHAGCIQLITDNSISKSQSERLLALPTHASVGSLLNIAMPNCYTSRQWRSQGVPGRDVMVFAVEGWGNCLIRVTVNDSIVTRIESRCG